MKAIFENGSLAHSVVLRALKAIATIKMEQRESSSLSSTLATVARLVPGKEGSTLLYNISVLLEIEKCPNHLAIFLGS